MPAPGTVVWKGPETRRVVAFTFDDGPKSPFAERMLSVLRELGVKATFFVVGGSVETAPDLLRQIHDEGHELANHSYSHRDFTHLSDSDVMTEVRDTQRAVLRHTGQTLLWFRPPGGNTNARVQRLLAALGMVTVMWDVNAEDYAVLHHSFPIHDELKDIGGNYRVAHVVDVVSRVSSDVRPGSIVLMHNGGDVTVAAMRKIVPILREQGYGFVTLSQLMGKP